MDSDNVEKGFVKTDTGYWYLQWPADNQWGFALVDSNGNATPGGFGCGKWDFASPPSRIRARFETLLRELELRSCPT